MLDLEHNCECIYCCPNGHCECEDCAEPCPQDCVDELGGACFLMTTALVLKTDGTMETLDSIRLQDLQTAVGGWVQAIDLAPDLTMWLNEDGKLLGLPHNLTAQKLWDKTFWVGSDFVVGDVVLTGGTDEEGRTLPLATDTAQQVRELGKR